jgi:hypothetical protein
VKSFLAILGIFLTLTVNAQSQVAVKADEKENSDRLVWEISFTPGISLNAPNNFVYGFDTRIEKRFLHSFAWMVTAGYTEFTYTNGSEGILSLKAGGKVFVSPKAYLAAEVGGGMYTNGGGLIIAAPSVGTKVGNKWDFSFKFEAYSNFNYSISQFGLRAGYRLSK